jgi:hypothetical protein
VKRRDLLGEDDIERKRSKKHQPYRRDTRKSWYFPKYGYNVLVCHMSSTTTMANGEEDVKRKQVPIMIATAADSCP